MLKNYTGTALAFLLMFASAAYAQDNSTKFEMPEQTIEGAEEPVPPGEVVILTVSKMKKVPEHLVGATYAWKILEDGKEKKRVFVSNDQSSVIFGIGNTRGKITALLSITYLYGVKEKDKPGYKEIGQLSPGIIVQELKTVAPPEPPVPPPGPTPPPGPGPAPPPVPGPVFPDGKYQLSARSYKWATEQVQLAGEDKGKSAQALATSFNSIAAAIAAGTLRDAKTILSATKQNNQTALTQSGVPVQAWDGFGQSLQKYAFQLYQGGQLKTPEDFAQAWREVANGLEKVR